MTRRAFIAAVLVGAAGLAEARAEPISTVVELFTSQGCSSCPPADKLIAEIVASDPAVLAISLPVDYWDYVGWKDTLADKSFTARQKAYGESRGDRQVYTPQAVVDGVGHAVGSDKAAIFAAAKDGHSRAALSVPVSVEAGAGTITVSLPEAKASLRKPASVYFVPVMRRVEVAIGKGENKGKTIAYTNVAREMAHLGAWDGSPRAFQVPASAARMRGADSWVVLVQEGTPERPGLILGAAKGPGL
ncbi:DUF1223 domain-containing protein [Alsobacter sp. SYSU M60028]|uniref:DUF1223 domain-containing protein n=1 Tax=Alsobacter ponti TaxID=2962936 RepID=A0ABT1LE74_9HYPH|nr:DUF1223 domain-containing protein [Alsobacter ponti]MCP8939807.1 DUF1223 domain-containing protein [Alsobacter ponti]